MMYLRKIPSERQDLFAKGKSAREMACSIWFPATWSELDDDKVSSIALMTTIVNTQTFCR